LEVDESPAVGVPLGSRIRAARELRAYTQGETVALMPQRITTAALSQIESGKYRPSDDTVQALSSALEVPAEYFSVQWPSGSSGLNPPTAFFRDLRATPVRERRRALAMATLLNDLVAAIEHHVRLPQVELDRIPVEAGVQRDAIEQAARTLRASWGLGDGPIIHVIRTLERHGIPVARLAIGHRTVDAFSVAFERRPLVLLTVDKSNYVRSRFDAAHELGHIAMHFDRTVTDRTIEAQAHSFAASFLLPAPAALEELPERLDTNGWARLAQMKSRWGISIAALLRRSRDLRVLSDNDYTNAMRFMSTRGWRTQEPGDRELGPPEAPLLLERALRTIEIRNGITTEELIQAAHLPLGDTLELLHASHDGRPVVEF